MTEFSPRSYLRDASGPRVVETDRERNRASRHCRQDDARSHKAKRSGEKKSRSKPEQSLWTESKSRSSNQAKERTTFALNVVTQPPKVVTLGVDVSLSVVASIIFSSSEAASRGLKGDRSRFLGVASLVLETSNGERIPMEPDAMVAQQLVDSLRPIPEECVQRMIQAQPCRIPLGYFSFSELLIRQSGNYRVRVSLIQVPGAGVSPMTVATLDSEPIRVERRLPIGHQRWQQRSQM